MIGDTSQDFAQVGIGFGAIEHRRADQTVESSRTRAAAIGAGEQIIAATQDKGTNRALRGVVVDLDSACH